MSYEPIKPTVCFRQAGCQGTDYKISVITEACLTVNIGHGMNVCVVVKYTNYNNTNNSHGQILSITVSKS